MIICNIFKRKRRRQNWKTGVKYESFDKDHLIHGFCASVHVFVICILVRECELDSCIECRCIQLGMEERRGGEGKGQTVKDVKGRCIKQRKKERKRNGERERVWKIGETSL